MSAPVPFDADLDDPRRIVQLIPYTAPVVVCSGGHTRVMDEADWRADEVAMSAAAYD